MKMGNFWVDGGIFYFTIWGFGLGNNLSLGRKFEIFGVEGSGFSN